MMTRDQKLLAALTRDEQDMAACAWRRSRMSWREIGRRLGADKDALRRRLAAQGRADGWGVDRSKPAESRSNGRVKNGNLTKSKS